MRSQRDDRAVRRVKPVMDAEPEVEVIPYEVVVMEEAVVADGEDVLPRAKRDVVPDETDGEANDEEKLD